MSSTASFVIFTKFVGTVVKKARICRTVNRRDLAVQYLLNVYANEVVFFTGRKYLRGIVCLGGSEGVCCAAEE